MNLRLKNFPKTVMCPNSECRKLFQRNKGINYVCPYCKRYFFIWSKNVKIFKRTEDNTLVDVTDNKNVKLLLQRMKEKYSTRNYIQSEIV